MNATYPQWENHRWVVVSWDADGIVVVDKYRFFLKALWEYRQLVK